MQYWLFKSEPEAYGIDPAPTFDGVSMFWFDNPDPFDLTGETDQKVVFEKQ